MDDFELLQGVMLPVYGADGKIFWGKYLGLATLKDGTAVRIGDVGGAIEYSADGQTPIYIKHEDVIKALLSAGLIEGSDE